MINIIKQIFITLLILGCLQIFVTVAAFYYIDNPLISLSLSFFWAFLSLLFLRWFILRTVRKIKEAAKDMLGGNGIVLRNAQVQVHSVKAIENAQSDDFEPDNRKAYEIELSIFPEQNNSAIQHWNPDKLELISIGGTSKFNAHAIQGLKLVDNFSAGNNVSGPQRLQFIALVNGSPTQLKLKYVFEIFGQIDLPDRFFNVKPTYID